MTEMTEAVISDREFTPSITMACACAALPTIILKTASTRFSPAPARLYRIMVLLRSFVFWFTLLLPSSLVSFLLFYAKPAVKINAGN